MATNVKVRLADEPSSTISGHSAEVTNGIRNLSGTWSIVSDSIIIADGWWQRCAIEASIAPTQLGAHPSAAAAPPSASVDTVVMTNIAGYISYLPHYDRIKRMDFLCRKDSVLYFFMLNF